MTRAVLSALVLLLTGLGAGGARAEPARALPQHLRDTGLFVEGSMIDVRPDVMPFSPQYPLWSDGATKRRWIWLPPGTRIDAAQADAWDFPRGTRLWKEFSHGDAIETRYIERGMDGEWRFGSYVWNADGTDAVLADPDGIRDLAAAGAPNGRYTIPAVDDCRACHEGAPVPVLGFSALQLSPDRDPLAPHAERTANAVDLNVLVSRGVLKNLSAALIAKPPRIEAQSPAERAALGYLHGNCGNCHNDEGPLAVLEMTLAQRVAAPPGARDAVKRSIVDVPSQFRAQGAPRDADRVEPGRLDASVLAMRMGSRDPLQQMPPLGTQAVDAEALSLIARWIETLPRPASGSGHTK
jgi:hypothetical protein